MAGSNDRSGAFAICAEVEPPASRLRFNATLDLARLQEAADAVSAGESEAGGSAATRMQTSIVLPGRSLSRGT